MRCFIPDSEEAERVREDSMVEVIGGHRVFTDPGTGARWRDFMNGFVPGGPFWSGLVRYPVPEEDVLLSVCAMSDDMAEVAGASLYLHSSVDTRARLLDLLESLVGRSPDLRRINVLVEHCAFEFSSGHQSGVGMTLQEINRQYELSKRCAERSIAIKMLLSQ